MADLYTVGILTVSDSSAQDNSLDKSGPLLKEILLDNKKYNVKEQAIVCDDMHDIRKCVQHWVDQLCLNVVLITGGTGFADRDVTPEAIKPLLTKETPGITHLLLSSSIDITPFAALSRPVSGIRHKSFIITLPGSPKACKENMQPLLKVLPHALDLLLDRSSAAKDTHSHIQGHVCVHRTDDETPKEGVSASLDTPVSRRARSSPYPLISVDQAIKIVAEHSKTLNVISVPVSQFLSGYVLAEDVKSLEPVPGYRASIVDGYAVHVEDGPGTYTIETISLASGSDQPKTLSRGKIARVTTGSIIPDGTTAVVMVEDTKLISTKGDEELEVEILVQMKPGENIREVGSDCPAGEIVGRKDQRVGGDLVGVLASVGVRHVRVYRKPRVGVLSSGNEVLDHIHTDNLKPGQIRDTNRISLLAAIMNHGFESVDLGIVDDNVDDMTERLEEALARTDVLITTGGVSMGEADLMKPILEQKMDATVHFGRVLMKPGKPTTFATVPQGKRPPKLVFALPGNPVSATVGFHLFVLPSLRRIAGWQQPDQTVVPVLIKNSIRLDSRPEFHRVQIVVDQKHGGFVAVSTGKQQSSRMLSMVDANGLLKLPESSPTLREIPEGSKVPCILIGALAN